MTTDGGIWSAVSTFPKGGGRVIWFGDKVDVKVGCPEQYAISYSGEHIVADLTRINGVDVYREIKKGPSGKVETISIWANKANTK